MKTQIEKIRAIDPAAAEYIESKIFPKYGPERLKKIFSKKMWWQFWKKKRPERDVLDLFVWELTPQGSGYWFSIWFESGRVKNQTSGNLGGLDGTAN